jgi:PIN domain nuclease of toxin-antitoxin system
VTTLLLDTNAWLWMAANSPRLGVVAREVIGAATTELVLSAVCAWEVSIKWAAGRLPLPDPPEVFVATTMRAGALVPLGIGLDHVVRVASLPRLHDDPFDRLLVAQAMETGYPVLSGDPMLRRYGIPVVDATI